MSFIYISSILIQKKRTPPFTCIDVTANDRQLYMSEEIDIG